MKLEDFDVFIFLPVLLVPFLAVLFALRKSDIGFLNVWFIWLSWVLSSIVIFIIAITLQVRTGIAFKLPAGVFTGLFLVAQFIVTFGITLIVTEILLKRFRSDEVATLQYTKASPKLLPSAKRIALIATLVATISMVSVFVGINAATSIYEYYYPKPQPEFGIYDI